MQLGAHYPGEPQNPENKVGPGGILGCNWWPNPPGNRGMPRISACIWLDQESIEIPREYAGRRQERGPQREKKREKD